MKINDFLDETTRKLSSHFPDLTIYNNSVPQGFEQPSVLVYISNPDDSLENWTSYERTVDIVIVYFPNNSEEFDKQTKMFEMIDELKVYFENIFTINDRNLKINETSYQIFEDRVNFSFPLFVSIPREIEEFKYDKMETLELNNEVV